MNIQNQNDMSESIKNRNEAYKSILDTLTSSRKRIFRELHKKPGSTAQQIAINLGLEINEVSGRITELKEMYLIKEAGSRLNNGTRKKNTMYEAVNDLGKRIEALNKDYCLLIARRDAITNDLNTNSLCIETKIVLRSHLKAINNKINRLDKIANSIQS